jgi:hypothetical protein
LCIVTFVLSIKTSFTMTILLIFLALSFAGIGLIFGYSVFEEKFFNSPNSNESATL